MLTKQETIGRGHLGMGVGVAAGSGTQENCSAKWLSVLGFMLAGLFLVCLWPFWFRVLPGGLRITQPRWIPARRNLEVGKTCCLASPLSFDLSQIFSVGNSLLVTRSLPGSPVVR